MKNNLMRLCAAVLLTVSSVQIAHSAQDQQTLCAKTQNRFNFEQIKNDVRSLVPYLNKTTPAERTQLRAQFADRMKVLKYTSEQEIAELGMQLDQSKTFSNFLSKNGAKAEAALYLTVMYHAAYKNSWVGFAFTGSVHEEVVKTLKQINIKKYNNLEVKPEHKSSRLKRAGIVAGLIAAAGATGYAARLAWKKWRPEHKGDDVQEEDVRERQGFGDTIKADWNWFKRQFTKEGYVATKWNSWFAKKENENKTEEKDASSQEADQEDEFVGDVYLNLQQ